MKAAPTCFGSRRNHHQAATTSALPKLQVLFNCTCLYRVVSIMEAYFDLVCVCVLDSVKKYFFTQVVAP